MEEILELFKQDFSSLLISVFIILVGIKAIISLFEWFITKFGIETNWIKKKREDHELLTQTTKDLTLLQKEHKESVEQSIKHDKEIKNNLSNFMVEIKQSVSEIKSEQKELSLLIEKIIELNNTQRNAMMEEMCDRIGQKTRYYINDLKGIPEDEYEDFVRLFNAYKSINGNHGAEAKYNYCINNLPILPAKSKVIKEENKDKNVG
jgi:type II secretory pathway component PulC